MWISGPLVSSSPRSGKVSIIMQVAVNGMSNSPTNIHQLQKTARYRVHRDFVDFYHNPFRQGEILTFMGIHFLPYHGGYTVVFKQKNLYLQEEANAEIFEALGDYLSRVAESSEG
jgi:hypothetical protein